MTREERDTEIRERLRALRVDPAEGDFRAGLRARLVADGPPRVPSLAWRLLSPLHGLRWAWPAAGVAAGLATFLVLSMVRTAGPGPAPVVAAPTVTRLPATRVALVRLNLTADAAVEQAHILVSLPPELSFWADGEALVDRSFEWTQPLRQGDNEIPIAVRGQRPGRYRIAVTARFGAGKVEDEVVLEVVDG